MPLYPNTRIILNYCLIDSTYRKKVKSQERYCVSMHILASKDRSGLASFNRKRVDLHIPIHFGVTWASYRNDDNRLRVFIEAGQRVEDGMSTEKIFNYSRFQFLSEQGALKEHGRKIILSARTERKEGPNLNFMRNLREDRRRKWETKYSHPYLNLRLLYFLKFWPLK